MTNYQEFEDPQGSARHARPAESGEASDATGSLNAGNPRARRLSGARVWLAGLAGLWLISLAISIFSLVKVSSLQPGLSHAQQQITAAKSELSSQEQQVSTDEQTISTLQSSVNSQLASS